VPCTDAADLLADEAREDQLAGGVGVAKGEQRGRDRPFMSAVPRP